jgi:hypothetical protein
MADDKNEPIALVTSWSADARDLMESGDSE